MAEAPFHLRLALLQVQKRQNRLCDAARHPFLIGLVGEQRALTVAVTEADFGQDGACLLFLVLLQAIQAHPRWMGGGTAA